MVGEPGEAVVVAGGEGGGEEREEAGEEENRARVPRVARRPVAPTKKEVEEHYPLHVEYRDWCEHCVAGRGMSAQHKQQIADKELLGHTIDMDYAFITPEQEDEDMCPVLVAYDGAQYGIWVMEVDRKGPTDETVKFVNG